MADTETITPDTNPKFQSEMELWTGSSDLFARPITDSSSVTTWTLVEPMDGVSYKVVKGLVDSAGEANIVEVQAGDVIEFTGKVLSVGAKEYTTDEPIQVGLSLGSSINAGKKHGENVLGAYGGSELLATQEVTDANGEFTVTATIPAEHQHTTDKGLCLLLCPATTSSQPEGGMGLQAPAVTITRTVDGGDGDDDGDGGPGWSNLPSLVAAYLGKPGSERYIERATAHVQIVTEYVRAYTRGKGFKDDGAIAPELQAVIVTATAKLTYNPEQVEMFRSGDYVERPQQFQGWTLADLGVLKRFRRTTA